MWQQFLMNVTVRQKREQSSFKLWKKKKKWLSEMLGNCQTHSFYESQNSPCKNNDKWHPSCLFTAYYTKGICASKHKGWKYRAGIAKGHRFRSLEGQQSPEARRLCGMTYYNESGWDCLGPISWRGTSLLHKDTLGFENFILSPSALWVDQEVLQARWSWNSPLDHPVPDQPSSSSCSPSKLSLL